MREKCKSKKYTYMNCVELDVKRSICPSGADFVKLDIKRSRPIGGLTVTVPIVLPTSGSGTIGQSGLSQ